MSKLDFDYGPPRHRGNLPGRHQVSGLMSLLVIGVLLLASASAGAAGSSGNASRVARALFTQEHPAAEVMDSRRGIKQVYGAAFEHGNTPEQAAQRFVNARSRMFGVEANELRAGSRAGQLQYSQGLMYDSASGGYRFTLLAYSQFKEDLPVFRSDLRLLVRNEPDSPLVLAASSLHDLMGYSIGASLRSDLASPAFIQRRFEAARQAALGRVPTLVNFGDPEVVVWAGVDDEAAQPAVALQFIADNHGVPNAGRPEAWLFLADVRTGEILYAEYLIRRTDVSGSVSGLVTTGIGADICEPEVAMPMPYARVNIGSTEAYAGPDGNFTIPNPGTIEVIVESPVRGERFVVTNLAGANIVLSKNVLPPGPADFLHNENNLDVDEYIRAQANSYVQANVVRDAIVSVNPAYPLISGQFDFPVLVNRNDGYCPGNAWYDPTLVTINFCRAGAGYPNTAWSSIIYHEYGHHLVEMGGSGQGAYGEGMGDVMSTIILDDPRIGLGFFGSCSTWLRDADNILQYPCSGEIHHCGQLIAGSVWDTREELIVTEPVQYQQTLMALAVNSVLLHSGSSIAPDITNAWLTLDDDDSSIENGTPHSAEILAGFGLHNMIPQPPPVNDACTDAIPVCPGVPQSGSTANAMNDGASSCGVSDDSPDAWYRYTPATSGSATFSLCGSGTTYDSVLSVHTACPGSSSNDIACDDDWCGNGGPSQVTLNVDAGTTYLIRVTGWYGSKGDFELNVSGPDCSPGCTSDGDCDDADACTTNRCVDGTCVYDPSVPCCGNLVCEASEDCGSCAADCIGQGPVTSGCGNGYCEPGEGEDCLSCPADCRGKQSGKPGNRYCCGDGDGENPVGCGDTRCSGGGFQCSDTLPGSYCCGDGTCESGEDSTNCELDCGVCEPITEICNNEVDDDCDGLVDCSDSDCSSDPSCTTSQCFPAGALCTADNECCPTLSCKGRPGSKTCR